MARLRAQSETLPKPRIDDIVPPAALPGGEVELIGANLGPVGSTSPSVFVDGSQAHILLSRPTRLSFKIPDLASTGLVEVRIGSSISNAAPIRVAHELNE